MSRLVTVPTLNVDDAITDAYVDAVTGSLNYLTQAGADLAAVGAGNTLTIASGFHRVTLAAGYTVDTITDPSAAAAAQPVELLFSNAGTIRNNGAGTGNIRTRTGADFRVAAGQVVQLIYDGIAAVWRVLETGPLVLRDGAHSVSNSLAITVLGQVTIPGNALGPNGIARYRASGYYQNSSAGTSNLTFYVSYGGATFQYSCLIQNAMESTSLLRPWTCDFLLNNVGATNAQWFAGRLSFGDFNGAPATGYGELRGPFNDANTFGRIFDFGASCAVDSTVPQTLGISFQHGTAAANIAVLSNATLVEVL